MRLQMQEGNMLKFRETDPTRDAPNPGGRNGDKNRYHVHGRAAGAGRVTVRNLL